MRGLDESGNELALPLALRPALGVLVEHHRLVFVTGPLHAPSKAVVTLSLLETTAAGLLARSKNGFDERPL